MCVLRTHPIPPAQPTSPKNPDATLTSAVVQLGATSCGLPNTTYECADCTDVSIAFLSSPPVFMGNFPFGTPVKTGLWASQSAAYGFITGARGACNITGVSLTSVVWDCHCPGTDICDSVLRRVITCATSAISHTRSCSKQAHVLVTPVSTDPAASQTPATSTATLL